MKLKEVVEQMKEELDCILQTYGEEKEVRYYELSVGCEVAGGKGLSWGCNDMRAPEKRRKNIERIINDHENGYPKEKTVMERFYKAMNEYLEEDLLQTQTKSRNVVKKTK